MSTAWMTAIRARPDDDEPRRIMADAFDAGDDPDLPADAARAEFIRLQCDLAAAKNPCRHVASCDFGNDRFHGYGMPGYFCQSNDCLRAFGERKKLLGPALDLLAVHWVRWAGRPFAHGDTVVCQNLDDTHGYNFGRPAEMAIEFRRGFVEAVWADWLWCASYLGAALALHPVREVTLADYPAIEARQHDGDRSICFTLRGFTPSGESRTASCVAGARDLRASRNPDGLAANVAPRLLGLLWPGVRFVLPRPPVIRWSDGPPALHEFRRDMADMRARIIEGLGIPPAVFRGDV